MTKIDGNGISIMHVGNEPAKSRWWIATAPSGRFETFLFSRSFLYEARRQALPGRPRIMKVDLCDRGHAEVLFKAGLRPQLREVFLRVIERRIEKRLARQEKA